MKINKIISQSRRDFTAEYECEHCGHTHKGSGYDDANFHQNVIPNMACPSCGKKAPENHSPLVVMLLMITVIIFTARIIFS